MNSNELKIELENYIKKNNTHYAVTISGDWGVGKTYFIKNLFLEDSKNDHLDKTYIYISLFGIESLDMLKQELFFQREYSSNRSSVEFINNLQNYIHVISNLDIKIKIVDDLFTLKNYRKRKKISLSDIVVIFDDFERHHLNVDDLFGYIDSLLDIQGNKVIILSDENHIDSEQKDVYKKKKEKIVNYTYEYDLDMTLLEKFIENYQFDFSEENNLKETLTNNIDFFYTTMDNSNHKNLRTFSFFLDKINDLLVHKNDFPNYKNVYMNLFEEDKIRKMFNFCICVKKGEKKSIDSESKKEKNQLKKIKYNSQSKIENFFYAFIKYNNLSLIEDVLFEFNLPMIIRFYEYEDADVKAAFKKVLTFGFENYSYSSIKELLAATICLADINVLKNNDIIKVENEIIKLFEKHKKDDKEEFEKNFNKFFSSQIYCYERKKELEDKIKEIEEKVYTKNFNSDVINIWINSGQYESTFDLEIFSLLKEDDVEKIIQKIQKSTNKEIENLIHIFMDIYSDNLDAIQNDYKNLKSLKVKLEKTSYSGIKSVQIDKLLKYIQHAINYYEKYQK